MAHNMVFKIVNISENPPNTLWVSIWVGFFEEMDIKAVQLTLVGKLIQCKPILN